MRFFDLKLKHLFSGFLARRHTSRQFKRQAILETLRNAGAGEGWAVSSRLSRDMRRIAADNNAAAIARLASHENGLTQAEADDRRSRVGPNEVEHEKPLPGWLHLWYCYKNPFNLLLTTLAVISFLSDDLEAAIIITT
ncbi:MAG: cation-transporting P-type ATPase, partial [Castellaniella sp.]|uniref:cation-transporting P-type ATPase n=1 Tax=Castellaniella sp. TaxID=1955812 RepID=UPI002A36DBB9